MTEAMTLETHVSTLFFTADRVFKLLKPIATGFLDHRDIATRIDAAAREVELNRRLAPDVYLGHADVLENGELVDRMIVMRRLPANKSMTRLVLRNELSSDDLRSVARHIASFHSSLPPIIDASGPGSLEVQKRNWHESFDEIEPHLGPVLDRPTQLRIAELVDRYLDGHEDLFAERVQKGFVRDGHGDLLADDIFLTDTGPKILDCLAFDARFRIGDVLSDIAFLVMDLHRLSGPAIAKSLIDHYCEFAGEVHPASLAHHYVAYRALVRCKVACLRVEQGDVEFAAVARMYQRLALDQLERARTRIVIVGGGPGTGKTSIANRIGERLGWPVLSSDVVRKELAGVAACTRAPAQPDEGIYTQEMTASTYRELVRRADVVVRGGESVVIDASFTREEHRVAVRRLARDAQADVVEIDCHVDAGLAKERVARRLADSWDPSDATPEIVDHLVRSRDPWPLAHEIETARPVEETMDDVLALLVDSAAGDPAPSVDFWGSYRRYTELASSRPFHTVI